MIDRHPLLHRLADGAPHAAELLARELALAPAALERALDELRAWGLGIESTATTHRLRGALDLVSAARLESALLPGSRARLDRLELFDEIDSTNAHLLCARRLVPGRWRACLAEFQSQGRGRRGRAWSAPPASGLCVSFAWAFQESPAALAAISLAAGVALLRALRAHGIGGLALKWPNDVLKDGRKLGGILSEVRAEAEGGIYLVIGVGLNVRLPDAARAAIRAAGGLEPADLVNDGGVPNRTALAASVLDCLVAMASEFAAQGFGPFQPEWNGADALRDRAVRVSDQALEREGVARGIDADGALRFERGGKLERLTAGDVTLRAVA